MEVIEKHLGLNDQKKRYVAKISGLYANLSPNSQDFWHDRSLRAGRSLLTSCALKLQSEDLFMEDRSVILALVGRYYSIFHGCFALLCQHPAIPYKRLERMHHRTLEGNMMSHFVRAGMLDSDFAKVLRMAREAREAVNYSPNKLSRALDGRKMSDFAAETDRILGQLYATNLVLSATFSKSTNGFVSSLQTIIGDGIGEDWVSDFCSRKDRNRIWRVLLEYGLTT